MRRTFERQTKMTKQSIRIVVLLHFRTLCCDLNNARGFSRNRSYCNIARSDALRRQHRGNIDAHPEQALRAIYQSYSDYGSLTVFINCRYVQQSNAWRVRRLLEANNAMHCKTTTQYESSFEKLVDSFLFDYSNMSAKYSNCVF